MRPLAPLVLVSVLLSGCAGLILRDEDSGLETTGKVFGRVVLGLATVGVSEIGIEAAKLQEAKQTSIENGQAGCKAQGLIYVYYDYPFRSVGCMTQQGFEQLKIAEAQNRGGIDPVAALLLMQGLNAPRYQYQPLPVPKLATTCFGSALGPVVQCY
jgi:hypothetical protein